MCAEFTAHCQTGNMPVLERVTSVCVKPKNGTVLKAVKNLTEGSQRDGDYDTDVSV